MANPKKPKGPVTAVGKNIVAISDQVAKLFGRANATDEQLAGHKDAIDDHAGLLDSLGTSSSDHERRIVELENPPDDEQILLENLKKILDLK